MRSKQAMQWHSSQTVVCRAGWQVDLQAQRWHNAVMAAPPTVMPFTTLTDRYCAAGLILCISSAWFWTYGSAWTYQSRCTFPGGEMKYLLWRGHCWLWGQPMVVDADDLGLDNVSLEPVWSHPLSYVINTQVPATGESWRHLSPITAAVFWDRCVLQWEPFLLFLCLMTISLFIFALYHWCCCICDYVPFCMLFRFQNQYGSRMHTALAYSMNSEFGRVLAAQMVCQHALFMN